MIFEQLNPGSCLSYLVGDSSTAEVAIVDPVINFVDTYMDLLRKRGLKLTHAIDTHCHADHISGAARLLDLTGCHYAMHEKASPRCVTLKMNDGDELKIGALSIKILHTPGHTRDSIVLLAGERIMTGDTLFLDDGGAGRDDLPGGNPADHFESLRKLLSLADNLIVCPGHDYRNRKPSSLREQRQHNPFFKPGSKDSYIQYVSELKLGPAEWMKAVLKANAECTRDQGAVNIPTDVPACEIMGTATTCEAVQSLASISPEELRNRLQAGEPLLLLDVRELRELTAEPGHLPGIVHIALNELEERLTQLSAHKNKTIISICRSGARATRAANILRTAGFGNVLVMAGGMLAWRDQGLPTKSHEPVS